MRRVEVLLISFLFFSSLLVFTFFYMDVSITGNVPLTGVLKDEVDFELVDQRLEMDFFLTDDLYYRFRDISFDLRLKPDLDSRVNLELDYLILDDKGGVVYSETEEIVVDKEMVYSRVFDNREIQQMEVVEGNYSFFLIAKYLGKEETFSNFFEMKKISKFLYSLKQLFDIRFDLDSTSLKSSSDLSSRVTFESFGEEKTPVNLTFFIYDSFENEIYRGDLSLEVETEEVVFFDYEGFEADAGEYTAVLRTFYNLDVEDYFEQDFVIRKKVSLWPFFIVSCIFILGIYFVFLRKLR